MLNRRSTEAARLTQKKLARRRFGLKKGLGDSQGQRGKPKSKTYRQGKTSGGTGGSKNGRQRRVSTETKRRSAKRKPEEAKEKRDREKLTEGKNGRKNKNQAKRRPWLEEEEKRRRESEIPQQEKLGGRSGRLEKTCNRKTRKE